MISFEKITNNSALKYILYIVAGMVVIWLGFKLVQRFFPTIITSGGGQNATDNLIALGSAPSVNAGDGSDINESDFQYLGNTSFNVNRLAEDPSNSVQRYEKVMGADGRMYWNPVPMASTGDYLSKSEFESIIDRQINRNMTPELKYMTLPKYIRNASNFFGTYQPTENTLDKCLDKSDVPVEGGLLGQPKWGQY